MGSLNVVLPDEVETRFRKAVFEKMGMKKGNLSEAMEGAVDMWIEPRLRVKDNWLPHKILKQ